MNQQSEHLSDAQIERFGLQTSGAGPGERQHEEDQRVDGHLADCSACRSRLLELQRTYLAVQADLQMNHVSTSDCPAEDDIRKLAAGLCPENVSAKLLHHVSTCDYCGALLKSVSEDLSVCEDLSASKDLSASEDLANDFSTEEQEALARLSSATPEWQQQTAREMLRTAFAAGSANSTSAAQNIDTADDAKQDSAASITDHASRTSKAAAAPVPGTPGPMTHVSLRSTSVTSVSGTREPETPVSGTSVPAGPILVAKLPKASFIWKWKLVPAAAAACAMIVFGIMYATRDTPEKVEKLLAQAYTEQRTMEMRIPGAEWGPVRTTRGSVDSRFSRPTPLLTAEAIIGKHQSQPSGNTEWTHLQAEADILVGNPESAIEILKEGLRSAPGSKELMMDLAIAYSQRSASSLNSDRVQAIELFTAVLQKDPRNPVALFNLALTYTDSERWDQAIATWNDYLEIDPASRWRQEAIQKRDLANSKLHINLNP